MVDDARFVDNGKVITSAGLTSGIDAAFHTVSLYQGNAQTQKLANLLEYNWTPASNYVRGKLADKYLINLLYLFTPFECNLTKYQGNENNWLIDITLTTTLSQYEIEKLIHTQATELNKWKPSGNKNEWQFTDKGKKWLCTIKPRELSNKSYYISFKVKVAATQ